jgi:DnaK suppressor protein
MDYNLTAVGEVLIEDQTAINKLSKEEKTRYSDGELQEFKKLIIAKLEKARLEVQEMHAIIKTSNENGTDDTGRAFKFFEEGYDAMAKEEAGQFANRQMRFIEQLENALIRIETKNYGVCQITGKLIPKERLKIVPHTIHSIEAKNKF